MTLRPTALCCPYACHKFPAIQSTENAKKPATPDNMFMARILRPAHSVDRSDAGLARAENYRLESQ
jgi:hypothetical protein